MFQNIQLLRAWAAVLVLLHHSHDHYVAMGGSNPLLLAVMPWGFVGVDVFFVVSGFVMMHVIRGREASPADVADFLGRRFLRIYSWYWPCLAITLLTIWHFHPQDLQRIDLTGSILLTSIGLHELALPISWSLTYELYFYGLVALVWAAAGRYLQPVFWVAVGALAVFSSFATYREGTALSFFANPMILEFLAGALLYLNKARVSRRGLLPLLFAAAGGLFWLGMAQHATNAFPRVYAFGAAAFFLVWCLVVLESTGLYRAGKWVSALGDASYSIYLLHLPFLTLFYFSGLRDWLERLPGGWPAEAGFAATTGTFLLVCVALHRTLERPLYLFLCRQLPPLVPEKHGQPDAQLRW
jgi:exopolysaccharide production protein ExoZ